MTTAAEPTLRMLPLDQLRDRSRFIRVPHVPMFDAHPKISEQKPEVTVDDLRLILANINRRIVENDVCPLVIAGHTCDPGPSCREEDQPEVLGYAVNWTLGEFKGKPTLFADMYIEREMYRIARKLRFRSVERHISDDPERNFIDYVAMLASPPQRDLGILTYGREIEGVVRYGRAFPNAFAKGNKEHRKRKDRRYKDETHINHDQLKSMVREYLKKMRQRKPAEPDPGAIEPKEKPGKLNSINPASDRVETPKTRKAKYANGDDLDPGLGNRPTRPGPTAGVMDNVKSTFGNMKKAKVVGPGSPASAPAPRSNPSARFPRSNPSALFPKAPEPSNPRQVTVNTGDSFTVGGRTYHVAGFDSGAGKIHFKNPETGMTRTATHAEFQDAMRLGRLAHTPAARSLPAPPPQAALQAPAAPSRGMHPVDHPSQQTRGMSIIDGPQPGGQGQPTPVAPVSPAARRPTRSAPPPPKSGVSLASAPPVEPGPIEAHPEPPVPVGPAPGVLEPQILYEGGGSGGGPMPYESLEPQILYEGGGPVPYVAPKPQAVPADRPAAVAAPKVRSGKPPKLDRPATNPLRPTHVVPSAGPGGPMVAASRPRDVYGIPHQSLLQDLADGDKLPAIFRKTQPKVTHISRSVPNGAGMSWPNRPQAQPDAAPAPGLNPSDPLPASSPPGSVPDSDPATEPRDASPAAAPPRDPRQVIVGQKHPGPATEAAKVSLRNKKARRSLNLGPSAGEALRGLMTGVTGRFGDWWYQHAKTPLWKGRPDQIGNQPFIAGSVGAHRHWQGGGVEPNLYPGYGTPSVRSAHGGFAKAATAGNAPRHGAPPPKKAPALNAPEPTANPFTDHLAAAYAAHADRFGEQAKSPHRKAKVVQAADLLASMEAKNAIDPREFQELHSLHADFVRAEGREPTPAQLVQEYAAQKQAKSNPQAAPPPSTAPQQGQPAPQAQASPEPAPQPKRKPPAPRLETGGQIMTQREREQHIKDAVLAAQSLGMRHKDAVELINAAASQGHFKDLNDLVYKAFSNKPKPSGAPAGAPPPQSRAEPPQEQSVQDGSREPEDRPMPDWLGKERDKLANESDRLGMSDKIEDMAASRMTANEIARKLGVDQNYVLAVQSNRGIPSMDQKDDFDAWLKSRESKAAPPGPQPQDAQSREWWHSPPVEDRPEPNTQGAPPPGSTEPGESPGKDPYIRNLERLYAAHANRGRKGPKGPASQDTVVRAANALAKRQRVDTVDPQDFQDLHRLSGAIFREKGLEPTPSQLLSAWIKGKSKTSGHKPVAVA